MLPNMYKLNIWKLKKCKTVLNVFIEIVKKSHCKPNKLWVGQERELYDKLMQDWLDNNDILVIAERFIKTLEAKTY